MDVRKLGWAVLLELTKACWRDWSATTLWRSMVLLGVRLENDQRVIS